MTIRLYCDEDSMDRDLVRALLARGMDVTTALEEKMIDREDAEHLDYAHSRGAYSLALIVAIFTSFIRNICRKISFILVLSLPTSRIIRWASKCVEFCVCRLLCLRRICKTGLSF